MQTTVLAESDNNSSLDEAIMISFVRLALKMWHHPILAIDSQAVSQSQKYPFMLIQTLCIIDQYGWASCTPDQLFHTLFCLVDQPIHSCAEV